MAEYKESSDHWRLSLPGKRCRFVGGLGHQHCGQPAILECNRRWFSVGQGQSWWAYCENHTYGRVIRDGEVWYVPLEGRDG